MLLDSSLLPAILWPAVSKRLLQKCQGKENLIKILRYSHILIWFKFRWKQDYMLSTHKVILAETFSPTFVGLTFRVSVKTRWNQMSVTIFSTRTIKRNDSQFSCSFSYCKVSTSKNYLCLMIVCVFSGSCGDLLHPSKPHPHCYWSKEILPNIPFLNFENLRLERIILALKNTKILSNRSTLSFILDVFPVFLWQILSNFLSKSKMQPRGWFHFWF